MINDIDRALADLRLAAPRYAKSERYYDGDHDLAFATEKFVNTFGTLFREFALNLCPVVCDAVRDKLKVVGFSTDSYEVTKSQSTGGKNSANLLNSATRRIWHANASWCRSTRRR